MHNNFRSEAAFESVIETHLLAHGYLRLAPDGFDRERAIFPETVLGFIRETQPKEWDKLEALHGERTGEQVLGDLCKWMDQNGALATLRHGFKCYGRTLRVAYFKAAHALNPELEARYAANRLGLTRQLHYLAALGEVARRHAQSERHPGRDAGAEEPADRPDRRGCAAPVPAGPRPARDRSSSSSGAPWSISRWIPSPC